MTKGFGPDAVVAAAAAGCTAIGENYAQELATKAGPAAAAGSPSTSSGACNRTRCACWPATSTSTRRSIGRRSSARSPSGHPGATVLVQVNATGEAAKGGCDPGAVGALVEACVAAGLDVDGLMTVGPTVGGPEAARPAFRTLRRLVDELGLRTCSMGMTDDLEVAVQEGSTRVRIGTALFGPRRAQRA